MSNQSFKMVFVSNNPSLLAQGSTVDKLAVGQLGIIDSKTSLGVTSPTYATTKALEFVLGTPDLGDQPLLSGVPNSHIFSKIVKGKAITGFRGKRAKKGKNQVVAVGFSGDVTDTDSLLVKKGETKRLFVTLTGRPIDKLYTKQGLTRSYVFESTVATDCEDTCATENPILVAESIAKQINADKFVNRFIKASVVKSCDPALDPETTRTVYRFQLKVADTQDNQALGLVQSQYPTLSVKRVGVEGINSVYEIEKLVNSAPTAFSNAGITLIPNCDTCPSGYTKEVPGFVYTVVAEDADADISATIVTKINTAHTGAATVAVKLSNDNYVVVTQLNLTVAQIEAAIEASSGPAVSSVVFKYQSNRSLCVLTTATTVAWAAASPNLVQYTKKFRITLGDTVCGSLRLSELQAAFPDLTVATVDADGSCVHTYETTVYSNPVEVGCSVESISFAKPDAFDGVQWIEVPAAAIPTNTVCKAGIKIEVAFVDRNTNECTFDYFPYEADTVHVTASTFEPNYNEHPNKSEWAFKQLQGVEYPSGAGNFVQRLEKESLGYELRERSFDPVVRENEGYEFNAKASKFYDEYAVDFEFEYSVGGWGKKYSENYTLRFFFPEGTGKAFETAINAYLTSAGSSVDTVIL